MIRYERLEKLGEGGMGIVYRCRDRLTNNIVALKSVLTGSAPPTPRLRLSLAQEFNTLASLYHPHIIRVLDYGFDEQGFPFFTMNYIPNARTLIEAGTDEAERPRLLADVLKALAYLHRHGIVHRDLKPANVLVDASGHVYVLDFGLALHNRGDEEQQISGTVAYMAPEALRQRPITPRADLFAVGLLAYHMWAGEHPHQGVSVPQTIINIINQPPDLTAIPVSTIRPIVGRLLAKEPADRYPSAEAAIDALAAATTTPINRESPTLRESYLTASAFVGREAELTQLETALEQAMQGQGQAWLIAGESGVGKSRLLNELWIRALVGGALVLRGQGIEGGGIPFQLWRQAVSQLTLTVQPAENELTTLTPLLPPHHPLMVGQPETQLTDVAATIARLLRRLPGPAVILMEDLQWAEESLDPLKLLMPDLATLPILVVGTYRSDEVSAPPLPEATLIPLKRLGREAIQALSASMIGHQAAKPELIDYLTRQTEGNAFFLVETMRELADEAGQLRDIATMPLPERVTSEGVQTLVLRRLARVPAEHQPLLKLAAVVGRRIEPTLMQHIAAGPIDGWLAICTAASVVEAAGTEIRFAHDKLREGLLDALTPAERQQLNQQAAEAIQAHYGDDPDQAVRLARHWQAAGNTDKERHFIAKAAKRSDSIGALNDAIRHYKQLRALTPQTQTWDYVHVLYSLGSVQERAAYFDDAQTTLTEALQRVKTVEAPQIHTEILEALANIAYMKDQLDEAERLVRAAQAVLGDDMPPVIRARLYTVIGRIAWQRGDYATMLEADKAYLATLIEQKAPIERLVSAYNNVGFAAMHTGDYATAEVYLKKGLEHNPEGDELLPVFLTLNLAEVYRRTRKPAQAWPHIMAGLRAYKRLRLDYLALEALTIAAGLHGIEGNPTAGITLLGQITQHPSVDVEIRTIMDNVKAALIALTDEKTVTEGIANTTPTDLDTLIEETLA